MAVRRFLGAPRKFSFNTSTQERIHRLNAKQPVSVQSLDLLRANAGDRAQPSAPNAPWHQSSEIGSMARLRDPDHVDRGRRSSRQVQAMARDVLNSSLLAARAMIHQKPRRSASADGQGSCRSAHCHCAGAQTQQVDYLSIFSTHPLA